MNIKDQLTASIAQDGGLAVYTHFGFAVGGPKQQKRNPFREESTCSFAIFKGDGGRIFHKDHGDDEYSGDCWKFVQQIMGIDAKAAYPILCEIYGLEKPKGVHVPLPPKAAAPKAAADAPAKKIGHINFRPFNEAELEFLELKTNSKGHHIAAVFLAVDSFSFEGMPSNDNLQFMFAVQIVAGESYKLYSPKEDFRPKWMPAKTLYFPGLAPAKAGNPDYYYSIGEIPQGKPVVLVGGESDYIAVTAMGFHAITLGAEVATLPKPLADELARKKCQLFVLFDTDFTGELHSRAIEKNYPALGTTRIELPLERQYWRFDQAKNQWRYALDGQLYDAPGTDGLREKPANNDVCDAISIGIDVKSVIQKTIDMKGEAVVYWPTAEFYENLVIAHKSMMPFMDCGLFYTTIDQLIDSVGKPITAVWAAINEDITNITVLLEQLYELQWSESTDYSKWQKNIVKLSMRIQDALEIIVQAPNNVKMLHLAQLKTAMRATDINDFWRDIMDRAYAHKVLNTINITKISKAKLTHHFGGEEVFDFYQKHREVIGVKRFIFDKKINQFDNETGEIVVLRHQDADAYIRIGSDYARFVPTLLKADGDKMITVISIQKRSVSEIVRDYGKPFVRDIMQVDGMTIEPRNDDSYRRIIETDALGYQGKLLNMYEPMQWKPTSGRFPNTLKYLKHIFGGSATATQAADGTVNETNIYGDTFSIALDWVTLLITKPSQNLPVILLLSKDQGTGKTTFGTWLNTIMGNNAISLKLSDFMNDFNMIHAFKTLCVIDEALFNLEDKQAMTALKNITTANNVVATPKGIDSQIIPNNKKLIICNNDIDRPMKIDENDTRYFCIKVPPVPAADKDSHFVSKMIEEIPAFLEYIFRRRVFHTDEDRMWFKPEIVRTEQFWHIVNQTKAGFEKEVLNFLKECFMSYKMAEIKADIQTLMLVLNESYSKYKIGEDQLREVLKQKGYVKSDKPGYAEIPVGIEFLDGVVSVQWYRKKDGKKPFGRLFCLRAQDFLTEQELAEIAEPFPLETPKTAKADETTETVDWYPFI